MSDHISKDRSPRSPSSTLEEAITQTKRLFEQIRTASVKPELAAKALGYSGVNGAAMTVLATLAQYGLVDRSGGDVSITPLAVKILHPKGVDQRDEAIIEASTTPKVLMELYNGFFNCSEEVIAGHLIQSGFNPEKAKKVASIHVANKDFAKLGDPGLTLVDEKIAAEEQRERGRDALFSARFAHSSEESPEQEAPTTNRKMLAQYQIPLGANEATLVFTGDALVPADFDELIDYVELFKRQFERKLGIETPSPAKTHPRKIESPTPVFDPPEDTRSEYEVD